MNTNKHMIQFYGWLSLLSLTGTYLISLNEQLDLIQSSIIGLSNSFCFAITSGIFTGVLVALAIEVRQYQLSKHELQVELYKKASELYSKVNVCCKFIDHLIACDEILSPIEGSEIRKLNEDCLELAAIDYVPFLKRDKVFGAYCNFSSQMGFIHQSIS